MSGKIPATLIPGDGIGPEITEAVTRIVDAMGSPFEWDVQQGGMAGICRNSISKSRTVRPFGTAFEISGSRFHLSSSNPPSLKFFFGKGPCGP